ncbi:forespore regulator of the sigma-K checkpoint [Paenibacillus sp. yr247]|uniref:BofC C-terminal domain-containing protein n=1 Tax=Paenibacillus sp. yr247 TaxID=1761880 RepID=UPI00089083BE|nr:BofC C-terminal domain-containing protein [Paenibacillus sp. yr247]SDN55892.1 forespore regulator of the sigma-K checkpoint [Paenibacillus sp. yr247]
MDVQQFLKHWKRRLRWKRSWLTLGMFFLVGMASWVLYATGSFTHAGDSPIGAVRSTLAALTPEDDERYKEAITTLKRLTDSKESYLLKSYVCGEERSQLGLQTPEQLLNMQMKHPNWLLSLSANGEVTFTESIDDLSPACKEKAVFGIDGSSNLSLFNGTPAKDNVIRTFFQLNIKHLESSLPRDTVQQLRKGIRISDLEEYNSVLSTFSDYAVEETERAMTRP